MIGVVSAAVTTSVAELVGEAAVRSERRRVVITVSDQSALLAVIGRLHELGVTIEHVYRHAEDPIGSPDSGGVQGPS